MFRRFCPGPSPLSVAPAIARYLPAFAAAAGCVIGAATGTLWRRPPLATVGRTPRFSRSSVIPPVPAALPSGVLPSAGVAYVHYLSFMLCFGALVLERRLIRPNPDRQTATLMVITDIVYGLAALGVLVSGILRVVKYGQGSDFYMDNPLFWWKVGTYLAVGALSLYPTITYILWAIPLRKGELPQVSEALAGRLAWILNIELVGFAAIPLMASLMARGVGLSG